MGACRRGAADFTTLFGWNRSRDAQRALAPLIRASTDGISERPLAQALTGPLVRGDVDTIERHLAALARDPSLADLYRRLALELLTLDR